MMIAGRLFFIFMVTSLSRNVQNKAVFSPCIENIVAAFMDLSKTGCYFTLFNLL